MTYGNLLRNSLGERIAGDGLQVYLKDSGNCISLPSGQTTDPTPYPPRWSQYYTATRHVGVQSYPALGGLNYNRDIQLIAAGLDYGYHAGSPGPFNVVEPITSNFDDVIFVELNSLGILQAMSLCMTAPVFPQGKFKWIEAHPDQYTSALKYKVGSTDHPAPSSDTVGLIVRDGASNVQFDSRFPQLPVEDFFYLTKQQSQDILDGNLVLTHTLRSPIADLYVSLPNFWSFKFVNGDFYSLHIRKVSDTEVQIGRAWVDVYTGSGPQLTGFSYRDMMILFAK